MIYPLLAPGKISCLSRVAIASFLLIGIPALAQADTGVWRMTAEPAPLVNGSPVLFRVSAPPGVQVLHATWFGRQVSFRFDAACHCWYAIAGIDLNAHAGEYPLSLQPGTQPAPGPAFIFNVTVAQKRYPTTALSVAPAYVAPPAEVRLRIEEEQALKKSVFAQLSPETLWSGSFSAPVTTGVSAVFGSARTFNGVKKSQHEGLDYHASVGTAVRAANRGRVILARNLYFEGNCVAIDHGDGLITLYMHLSEIKVQEGDVVSGGQILGLSGGTGRVTGPHLHFAVRWQGLYVDPETLLLLQAPASR
jgi:murein DD-endopeptidase MepM/ murein hydrolase activator NlpD